MFNHKIYFNNVALPSFVLVKRINHQILCDIDNETIESEVGHKLRKTKLGTKIIEIEFSLLKDDSLPPFEQQQELLKWIKGDNWKPSRLILPDNLNVHYIAICNNGIKFNNEKVESLGTIEFLICDPYRISNIEKTTTTPFTISNKKEINYLNNIETFPRLKFKITSSCSEIKLNFTNEKYNNFVKLKHNFVLNDVIVIDMETKKVTVNDELKMQILTLDSRFHKICEGLNTYTKETGNFELYIYYKEKYL